MRPLREILRERRESLSLNDGLGDWQAITVKFSGEVMPRERDRAFKGAMFAAYAGDLVFSKIDARNGAIGLIPSSIPKAVVTTEYPVLVPDPARLRPAYLHHLLRAAHFKADLQRKASGTSGRKRVTSAGFLDLVVPVPALADQDALVTAYSAALDHAARLEREAQAIEDAALCAFEMALGLAAPPPLPERPMFVARFRDIERWSHEGISRAVSLPGSSTTPIWPLTRLGDVVADLETGGVRNATIIQPEKTDGAY
jgi:type I restriction enzyme S subunit